MLVAVSSKVGLRSAGVCRSSYLLFGADGQMWTGSEGVEELGTQFQRLLRHRKIAGGSCRKLGWNRTGGELQVSHEEARCSSQGARQWIVNLESFPRPVL